MDLLIDVLQRGRWYQFDDITLDREDRTFYGRYVDTTFTFPNAPGPENMLHIFSPYTNFVRGGALSQYAIFRNEMENIAEITERKFDYVELVRRL